MPQLFSLNEREKKFCLSLARKAIKHFFENQELLKVAEQEVPKKLLGEKACFVTLTKNKQLRGCVGHLEAIQPLYLDIVENAVHAAFSDTRFEPLQRGELKELEIEISVLTEPIEINFSSPEELLEKIIVGKDGLIIKKGYCSATFLPSVWEQIKTKEEFLSYLCIKAGLAPDGWKFPGIRVFKYSSLKIK